MAILLATLLFIVGGCNQPSTPSKALATDNTKAITRKSESGPVQLTVRVTPESPRLSDVVSLELIINAQENVEIIPPVFGKAVGDFLVLDYSEQTKDSNNQPLPPNSRAFRYQLEPVHTGKHIIRSIAIEYVDRRNAAQSDAKPEKIQSSPIEVEIVSEIGDGVPDLANLEPMESPRSLKENRSWLWAIAIMLIGSSAWLIWYGLRTINKPKSTPVVTIAPEELARNQLRDLLAEQLPQKGLVKEFYLRLTGIVRHYIESTTGLRAPEQTTEEFLRDLHRSNSIRPDQAIRLGDFLEAADMVKYAGQQPTNDQIDQSVERAREFIAIRASSASELPSNGTHTPPQSVPSPTVTGKETN